MTDEIDNKSDDVSGMRERRVTKIKDVSKAVVPISRLKEGTPHSSTPSGFVPGLFIVYGGAASNKSKMLSTLADKLSADNRPFEFIYAGEPDPRSIGSWAETLSVLKFGLLNEDGSTVMPECMLIDSLKDVLYAPSSDGAGSGGLSIEAIRELSNVSAQCMRENRIVIAVINPTQPKFMDDWYETIKTNVTGIFHLNYTQFDQSKGDKDLALAKNFVATSEGTTRSSLRYWNGEFYERLSNKPVTWLLGYNKSEEPLVTDVDKLKSVSASSVTGGRDLQARIFNKLLGSTPANQSQDI